MANASFTRDEAILALDVLFAYKDKSFLKNEAMDELSSLLKRLPIHPQQAENIDFRPPNGIYNQLSLFKRTISKGEKHPNVGKMFYTVMLEFEDRLEELHSVAEAIRRNENYFDESYGLSSEGAVFPEGRLLGHLHCSIETNAMDRMTVNDRCEICNLQPNRFYKPCSNLLQLHLLIPPVEMDGGRKYGDENYITVCPTCHAALHAVRPWLTKENIGDILR